MSWIIPKREVIEYDGTFESFRKMVLDYESRSGSGFDVDWEPGEAAIIDGVNVERYQFLYGIGFFASVNDLPSVEVVEITDLSDVIGMLSGVTSFARVSGTVYVGETKVEVGDFIVDGESVYKKQEVYVVE